MRINSALVAAGALLVAAIVVAYDMPADEVSVLCAGGYSRAHRMSADESRALKLTMLPPGSSLRDFQLDHVLPVCLGGSNERSNLQLQPWDEAKVKDEMEWTACSAVCRRRVPLDTARGWFKDWRAHYAEAMGR